MFDTKLLPGEKEEAYLWRLGQAKDSGLLELDWNQIADILNEEFREDESEYRTEAAYRKPYSQAKRFKDAGVFDTPATDYITQKRELERAKIAFRDERNEYNRIIREEARKESYLDLIIRTMAEHDKKYLGYWDHDFVEDAGNDLIIHCTDIHNGIHIDNWFNKFDQDILKDRFNDYLTKILEIQKRHHSQNAYLIIGEILSGLIHENLRCENNQNLIEQFLTVSDYLTDFLFELAHHFNEVHVYVTPGNHSRISPKKEQNLKGENFDNLLIPFLSARLQNISTIQFHKNEIEESIAMFNVRNNPVFASHGDKDTPENVVQRFTLLFNVVPKIVYLGHRHRNGLTTIFNSKVVESGSLSGVDNHSLDCRYNTKPEQTVSVVDENGLVCLYDIQF